MADTTMSGGANSEKPPSSTPALPPLVLQPLTLDSGDDTEAAGPTTPAKDTTAGDSEGPAPPKGKQKEEAAAVAAAASQSRDSLSIGPTDMAAAAANPDGGPVCNITLLLPTGARHPYRIDEKYLSKRNVDVPDLTEGGKKDPFSISVYKLKELILREWRDEWDGKPASPSSIRLIHFGKLLDDKEQLKKYQFSPEAPNVVHMSVRPAEMMEEDEAAKGKGSGRDGRNREGGSNCCVIL